MREGRNQRPYYGGASELLARGGSADLGQMITAPGAGAVAPFLANKEKAEIVTAILGEEISMCCSWLEHLQKAYMVPKHERTNSVLTDSNTESEKNPKI